MWYFHLPYPCCLLLSSMTALKSNSQKSWWKPVTRQPLEAECGWWCSFETCSQRISIIWPAWHFSVIPHLQGYFHLTRLRTHLQKQPSLHGHLLKTIRGNWTLWLPEAEKNSWGKPNSDQMIYEKNLWHDMSTGNFERLEHIPWDLEGYMLV